MKEILKNLRNSTFITLFYLIITQFGFQKTWYEYLIIFSIAVVILHLWTLLLPVWKFVKDIKRRYFVKVAILNGAIFSPVKEYKCVRSWIGVTPEMWRQALKPLFPYFGKSWNREFYEIPVTLIDDSWTMIINPFGDNFPEEDLRLHKTFYKICDYINKGGVFVITGGAFFWNQNTAFFGNLQAFVTNSVNGVQSLDISPLKEEFGVKYTGDSFENGVCILKEPISVKVNQEKEDIKRFGDLLQGIDTVKRFRATTSDSSNYLPVIRQQDDNTIFPISIVKYGEGSLVHIGLFIESENSDEFKIVLRLLENLIKTKFTNIK